MCATGAASRLALQALRKIPDPTEKKREPACGGRAGSLDPVVVGMGRVGTRPDRPDGPWRTDPYPCFYRDTELTVVTRVSEIPVQLTGELADWRLM